MADNRPNVILYTTDQHRGDCLGCAGNPVIKTPHLDSIVEWIHRVLPLDPAVIEVIATGSFDGKTDVLLRKEVSYFVEDRLETCFALMEAGVTPILFKRPWNRKKNPFVEVASWPELESLIAFDGNIDE